MAERRRKSDSSPKRVSQTSGNKKSDRLSLSQRTGQVSANPERKKPAIRRRPSQDNSFSARALNYLVLKEGTMDIWVVLVVIALTIFGFFMMASVQYALQDTSSIINQMISCGLGFIIMFVLSRVDYQIFNGHLTFVIFALTLIANGYTAAKALISKNINRGGSFQPSEILKFAVIITISYLICAWFRALNGEIGDGEHPPKLLRTQGRGEKFILRFGHNTFMANIWLLVVIAVSATSVLLQSHLSGAILVAFIGFSLMWAGGGNKKLLAGLLLAAAALIALVVLFPKIMTYIPGLKSYMYERVVLWKEKAVPDGETFSSDRSQIEASLKAISSGGWFGKGYGNSIMKYSYLAEAKTDFIFAIVVEELGYVGGLSVVALFAFLVGRLMSIARHTKDKFGSLIVIGVACHIAIQVILNIAVVTDSMPNTGITLPFFSYGRSALIMMFVEIGVALSVSRKSKVSARSGDGIVETEEEEE